MGADENLTKSDDYSPCHVPALASAVKQSTVSVVAAAPIIEEIVIDKKELDATLLTLNQEAFSQALAWGSTGLDIESLCIQRKIAECGVYAGAVCMKGRSEKLTEYCEVLCHNKLRLFAVYSGLYGDHKSKYFAKLFSFRLIKQLNKLAIDVSIEESVLQCWNGFRSSSAEAAGASVALFGFGLPQRKSFKTTVGNSVIIAVNASGGAPSFIVIASAGLWSILSENEVVTFVRSLLSQGNTCADVAKYLLAYAYNKGAIEGISLILVDLVQLSASLR